MKPAAGELGLPAYALHSVDKALRVMHMLRDGTPIRVSSVARDLDISASTAHRIMAMLVFHGFAVQDSQRRYLPGPALGAPVLMARDVDRLLEIAAPVLDDLAIAVGETVNLTLRVGPHTRVLLAVGTHGHTEMDRSGAVLPAHTTAAGRASLAQVSDDQVVHLFGGPAAERAGAALDEGAMGDLIRELNRTRTRGYAVSREEAVKGLDAIAIAVASATLRSVSIAVLTSKNRLDALIDDPERMRLIREAAVVLGHKLNLRD